ncbi:MAG: hybrid sensor histidine kinase/response regulator, partial [Deltaproteobacteria bacterium]|nr:hybrid sensor histidine kinase/response regulator [Deltaproteobacteria bacterium]
MAAFEILLLSDGSSLFRTIAWALESKGYGVAAVSSPEAAIKTLAVKNYDLLIARLTLDPQGGMDVIKRARKLNPETRIMVVGGDNQVAFPLDAYRLKIDDYVLMPCSPAELWRRVASCLGSLAARPPQSDSQVRLAAINERVLNKLAIMFHDLRSSLVSTSAALKLLMRGSQGYLDEAATQKIQEIYSQVKKIVGVSEEYMVQLLSGNNDVTLGAELLDLKQEIVEPVLDELSEEIQDHGITIENRLDDLPTGTIPVKGSKLFLKSVFRNLLSNGIKHGGDGCTVVINLEDRGDNCCLQVFNNGEPVLEENQPLLFSNSRRVAMGDKGRDQGLGLRLVKDIIKEHGGDIRYEP